jgi:hypothetical protein
MQLWLVRELDQRIAERVARVFRKIYAKIHKGRAARSVCLSSILRIDMAYGQALMEAGFAAGGSLYQYATGRIVL